MKFKRILTLVLALALVCSVFSGLSLLGVNAVTNTAATNLNAKPTNYGTSAVTTNFGGTSSQYTVPAEGLGGLAANTQIYRFQQTSSPKRWYAPKFDLTSCNLTPGTQYTAVVMMYNDNNNTYVDNGGKITWPVVMTSGIADRSVGMSAVVQTQVQAVYHQWVLVPLTFTVSSSLPTGGTVIAGMDGNDVTYAGATYYCGGVATSTNTSQIALLDTYFYLAGVYKTADYGLASSKVSAFGNGTVSLAYLENTNVIKTVRTCDGTQSGDANKNYNSFGFDITSLITGNGAGYYTVTTKLKEDASSAYAAGSDFLLYLSSGNTHASNAATVNVTSSAWKSVTNTIRLTAEQIAAGGSTWAFRLQGTNTIAGSDIFYAQDVTVTYSATDPNATPTPTTAPTTAPKTVAARLTFNAYPIYYFRDDAFLFFASDGVDSGSNTSVTFTLTNENSTDLIFKAFAQNGWGDVTGAVAAVKTVPAHTSVDFTVTIPSTSKSTANLRLDCVSDATGTTGANYNNYVIVISGLSEASLNKLGAASKTSGTGTCTGSKLTAFTPAYPATPTASPAGATATPIPTKTIVNGNAEGTGTTGWCAFLNGAVAQVSGGASNSAHAIQYTPGSGKYGSIGYNMGAAIVQDAANGYQGAGAGQYTLTFWTKLDASATVDSAAFTLYLNSLCHQSAAQVVTKVGGTSTAADFVDSYQPMGKDVTLTKTWQQITVTFTVTQKYLDTLKALYGATPANLNAYDVILRFDGSNGIFKTMADADTAGVKYLVDELTLTTPAKATPDSNGNTPTAKSVIGRQFTFTQAATFFCANTWTFVTADMVKNGTVTYKVTIGNASKETISLNARLQVMTKADGKDQWVDVTDLEPESYDLDPNTSYTFTITAAAESTLGDAKTKYTYANYFLRLDGNIPVGSVLIFTGINAENLAKMTSTSATAVDLYQLPSWMKGTTPTTSGDTILYASAACAVISAIALVYVVSRKKNEEEA